MAHSVYGIITTFEINHFLSCLAREWESLYQPVPLGQQLSDTLRLEEEKVEVRKEREMKIIENLNKMEAQLEAWRHRVSVKNRSAEGDRLRREKVETNF